MSIVPESYSLVLNSQTSSNITNNSNLSSYQYNINWASILPKKYKKYSVNFQLKSANASTVMFSGAQTSSLLTVNGLMYGGPIYVGMQYVNLTGLSTVTSFGTGTGGLGNYNITGVSNGTTTTLYSVNTTFNKNLLVSINFGKCETYDSSTQSNILGMIYPTSYPISPNITTSNYNSTVLDNGAIEIYYPSNNNITVSITNLDGTPFTNMAHYALQLYFNPITDENDE